MITQAQYNQLVDKIFKQIRSAYVYKKIQVVGDIYTDEPMRGENVKTLHLIDKGDLLTSDIFIDLLRAEGEVEEVGRHRIYKPKW